MTLMYRFISTPPPRYYGAHAPHVTPPPLAAERSKMARFIYNATEPPILRALVFGPMRRAD